MTAGAWRAVRVYLRGVSGLVYLGDLTGAPGEPASSVAAQAAAKWGGKPADYCMTSTDEPMLCADGSLASARRGGR